MAACCRPGFEISAAVEGWTYCFQHKPNEAPCLRLATAVVMEIAEDWQTADKR